MDVDRWNFFRLLALAASLATTGRMVWFLLIGSHRGYPWEEVCAMIGALLLFWIGTQRQRRRSEVQGVGLLGAILLLVHELPFAGGLLFGFLRTDRSALELAAIVPMGLCLATCYFAMVGMVSGRPD